ncbi:Uncharacterised protein [Pseudomonas aeruginosa]|nr:Uncharacterised protein [Pseudomonas aeruginosa]
MRVLRLDVHTHHHSLAVARQLVALHAADADLAVEDRRADVDRAELVAGQHQVQAGRVGVQRRRFRADGELATRRAALGEAHVDVVTFHQGLEAGDASQGDAWLDGPELGAFQQHVLDPRIHRQVGSGAAVVLVHVDRLDQADLHAVEHHRGAARIDAADVVHLQLHAQTGLGRVVVVVQAERLARIGRRAVASTIGSSESDAAGRQGQQRFATHLEAGQAAGNGDAAGVPESRVLAHQVGVGRLDVHLDLDGPLVIAQLEALHLADLDLPVEHRAALLQGAQAIGLEGQVQAGQPVGKGGRLLQRGEVAFFLLALHRIDRDVDAGDQGFQAGDASQGNPRLDQPEASTLAQVLARLLVHFDGGHHALDIFADIQRDDLADRDALVQHLGLLRLDAIAALEAHLDQHPCLVVGAPAQPGPDSQGHQRQHPDRRPVRGLVFLRAWQITHSRRPDWCCPR